TLCTALSDIVLHHEREDGYLPQAFHSHKVEPIGPVMDALVVNLIKIVRWTINRLFLPHSMTKSLPKIGLDHLAFTPLQQKKSITFNTDLGFITKIVDANIVDKEALLSFYQKISKSYNNLETNEEVRHIIRHTPTIRQPAVDKRGNFCKDDTEKICWIDSKVVKAKQKHQDDKVVPVLPEAHDKPEFRGGNEWKIC
ncbi:hypothetical protein HDU87_003782, partial [Geranomyces variabilis]